MRTAIGRSQHPRPNRLRCITGLGAKNPAVVMADADLDLAVKECVSGSLSFNGQRCTALKILFVHESLSSRFVDKFAAAVDALPEGMPWEPGVMLQKEGRWDPDELVAKLKDAFPGGIAPEGMMPMMMKSTGGAGVELG